MTMTDLRERFAATHEKPAPDLWPDVLDRLTDEASPGRLRLVGHARQSWVRRDAWRKVLTIAAAFILSVVSIAVMVRVFHVPDEVRAGAKGPVGLFSGLGGWITYASGGDIYAIDPASSGSGVAVTRLLFDGSPGTAYPLSWSSDGTRLLIGRLLPQDGGDHPITELYVLGDDGTVTRVPSSEGSVWGSFAPDGSIVFEQPAQAEGIPTGIERVDLSGRDPTFIGPAPTSGADWSPVVSADGTIAVFHIDGGPISIDVIDAQRRTIVAPDRLPRVIDVDGLAWSPDGTRLAFGLYTKDKASQVYVVNADGSDLRQIAVDAAWPSWSPDGSRISYLRSSDWMLMTSSPDGGDVQELGIRAREVASETIRGEAISRNGGPWNPAPRPVG
jgi:Tol biopolymer transport system component